MRYLLPAALILALGAGFAQSQGGSDKPAPVKARQGIMQNYAFSIGTLGGMAKGEVEYDAQAAQAAADRLVALSSLPQTGYWPEGTSSDDLEGVKALPAIWENMDDFTSGFDTLNEAAMVMAEVASDGQQAVAGQMQPLGKSCGACHEDYQMSDD